MTSVAVCIPIRNEAARLPELLHALARQEGVAGLDISLCLFFDACTDDSRAVVAERIRTLPFPVRERVGVPGLPNAGRARAMAMALGLEASGNDGVLLTTDADGVPADDWIARSCAALRDADVVAGRIVRLPHPPSPLQDRLERYYDRLFALRREIDPVAWESADTHHCTGGANLGFAAAAYEAVGGFLPLPHGEDARIVDDAARLGLRVRRDGASVVHTSARRSGRIAGGMADTLRRQDASGDIRVGDPADAAWQYRRQAEARRAFEGARPTYVAAMLGLTADHALGVARDCPNAEAFAMRIVPASPIAAGTVSLAVAEEALAALEAGWREVAA